MGNNYYQDISIEKEAIERLGEESANFIYENRHMLEDDVARRTAGVDISFRADNLRRRLNQMGKMLIERGGLTCGLGELTRLHEQIMLILKGFTFQTRIDEVAKESLFKGNVSMADHYITITSYVALRAKLVITTGELTNAEDRIVTLTDALHIGFNTSTRP